MSNVSYHSGILLIATTLAWGGTLAGKALAQQHVASVPVSITSERENAQMHNRNDDASMSDAIRRVQRATGGQILGAERVPFDGRNIHRVKYMDSHGHVLYMDDDPESTHTPSSETQLVNEPLPAASPPPYSLPLR